MTGDQVPGVKDQKYLCLSATHSYVSDAYGSGDETSDGYAYTGSYVLMPAYESPLAPERKTPVPAVLGPQTAVVVGEGEIDCDEYGRILVHFHWDLEKAYSMRCRVSQNWASQGWGGMVIPRIGMEVVVEFLEGDPDKPLVTGCVYNGKNKVPYELPKHKTRSTFKTKTHKGRGFNELRFEDEKGEEEIFVHAQKDRNEKIRNNHTERIDNNWVQSVGHNKAIEVTESHDEVIGGNMTIHIGSSQTRSVIGEMLSKAREGISGATSRLTLPIMNTVGRGMYALFSEKGIFESTLGMKSQFIGIAKTSYAGRSQNISAGKMVEINGAHAVTLNAGASMALHSAGETTIICGKSAITMNMNGDVHISGRNLYLDFESDIEVNAEGTLSNDANKITHKSDTGFTVKAAKIDLN